MYRSNCEKIEHNFSIAAFVTFILIVAFTTLFEIYPIVQSIFTATIYITLITAIFLAFESVKKIGLGNFAGKSLAYLGITSLVALINIVVVSVSIHLSLDRNFLFNFNQYMWFTQAILMTTAIFYLLSQYRLNLPKMIYIESSLFFLITILAISFFAGWPQLLNALLITAGIVSIRVSGKKLYCGLVYLSTGLILLAVSNIFFIYRSWNGISYFGDISDVVLSISWISIVLGIYFTKKYYA